MTELTQPSHLLSPSLTNEGDLYVGSSTFFQTGKATRVTYIDSGVGGTFMGLPFADLGMIGFENNANGLIYTIANTPLVFGTWGQQRMRITSDGLVGIGASAPAAKLDVDLGTGAGSALDVNFPSGSRGIRLKRAGGVTAEIFNDAGQPVTFTSYAQNGTAEGWARLAFFRAELEGSTGLPHLRLLARVYIWPVRVRRHPGGGFERSSLCGLLRSGSHHCKQ
jgi:hypothetical protein